MTTLIGLFYFVTLRSWVLSLTSAFSSEFDCCCSVAKSRPTLFDPMDCSTPGFPVPHHFPESVLIHVHSVGDVIQPSHPLSPSSPSAFNLSQHQGLFSNESALPIRCPKYWRFNFSINPSSEYSGLISFKIDWFDLLAVEKALRSLLQHHSFKAYILWRSAFFTVQLPQLNVTTGKTIALTVRTYVHRMMFLLFNTLSRFVIAFLQEAIFWFHGCSHHL